jgi:hypothetical protein
VPWGQFTVFDERRRGDNSKRRLERVVVARGGPPFGLSNASWSVIGTKIALEKKPTLFA